MTHLIGCSEASFSRLTSNSTFCLFKHLSGRPPISVATRLRKKKLATSQKPDVYPPCSQSSNLLRGSTEYMYKVLQEINSLDYVSFTFDSKSVFDPNQQSQKLCSRASNKPIQIASLQQIRDLVTNTGVATGQKSVIKIFVLKYNDTSKYDPPTGIEIRPFFEPESIATFRFSHNMVKSSNLFCFSLQNHNFLGVVLRFRLRLGLKK